MIQGGPTFPQTTVSLENHGRSDGLNAQGGLQIGEVISSSQLRIAEIMPHMPAPTGWINIGTPSYVSDAPPQKVDPAMYR